MDKKFCAVDGNVCTGKCCARNRTYKFAGKEEFCPALCDEKELKEHGRPQKRRPRRDEED